MNLELEKKLEKFLDLAIEALQDKIDDKAALDYKADAITRIQKQLDEEEDKP